jgi:DNA polymerase III sliding clamp (beta) subunit (PCNA family)
MPLHLPAALGPLVGSAADDQGRYSMNGVEIREQGNNTFCCTVTDGRQLVIARGPCPKRGMLSGMSDARVVVPSDAWQELFRKAPKGLTVWRPGLPALAEPVSIELLLNGKLRFTASAGRTFECDAVDGRFPDWSQIVPKTRPRFSIKVNPDFLIEVLRTVSRMLGDDNRQVTLCFWSDSAPMAVVAKDRDRGICLDALLMPLFRDPTPLPPPAAKKLPAPEGESEDEADKEEGT